MGAHHAEDVRAGELPGVLHELLEPIPRKLCLLDWRQLRRAGLIKSRTGATPFQSLMQLVFQESRSLTSSSKCFLVFTLSTTNRAGGQFKNKERNVEQSI